MIISRLDAGETYRFVVKATDRDSLSRFSNPAAMRIPCPARITSPAEGRVFDDGQSIAIRWSRSTCEDRIERIELLYQDAVCRVLATNLEDSGEFAWNAEGCSAGGNVYRIRLVTSNGDTSDSGAFTIREEATCEFDVVFPQGGEAFCAGDELEIAWSAGEACQDLSSVYLLRNGEVVRNLALRTEDLSLGWEAVRVDGMNSGYQIRVTRGQTSATSGMFSIHVPQEPPRVLQPSGGESFYDDQNLTITWATSDDCRGNRVRVRLLKDGVPCKVIRSSFSNENGRLDWSVESCEAGSGYRIEVEDLDTGFRGSSPEPFEITHSCHQALIEPVQDASYCVGDSVVIRWDRTRWCGETMRIELDGAETCTIAEAAPNTGEFVWIAERCDPQNDPLFYTLRLTDSDGNEMIPFGVRIWIGDETIGCQGQRADHLGR